MRLNSDEFMNSLTHHQKREKRNSKKAENLFLGEESRTRGVCFVFFVGIDHMAIGFKKNSLFLIPF